MKRLLITTFIFGSIFVAGSVNAQMMGARLPDGQGFSNTSVDWNEVVEHTAREEQEGKELWTKLQAKDVVCADLNDEQYGVLGEYFIGDYGRRFARRHERHDDSSAWRRRRGANPYSHGQAALRLRYGGGVSVNQRRLDADDEYDVGRPACRSGRVVVSLWQ